MRICMELVFEEHVSKPHWEAGGCNVCKSGTTSCYMARKEAMWTKRHNEREYIVSYYGSGVQPWQLKSIVWMKRVTKIFSTKEREPGILQFGNHTEENVYGYALGTVSNFSAWSQKQNTSCELSHHRRRTCRDVSRVRGSLFNSASSLFIGFFWLHRM